MKAAVIPALQGLGEQELKLNKKLQGLDTRTQVSGARRSIRKVRQAGAVVASTLANEQPSTPAGTTVIDKAARGLQRAAKAGEEAGAALAQL